MGIVQIAGLALLSVALILCLKELRASLALPARLAAALLLFGAAFALYVPVLDRIRALFSLSGAADFATPLLRAVGIAIICELAVSFCRDLGENTVANGVLLFGKLEILVLCLPLVDDVLEIAKELLKF
jgi:hypothetical protein